MNRHSDRTLRLLLASVVVGSAMLGSARVCAEFGNGGVWELAVIPGVADNNSTIGSADPEQFALGVDSGESLAIIVNRLQETRGRDRLYYELYAAKTRSSLDIRQQSGGQRQHVRMPVHYLQIGGSYEIAQPYTSLAPYLGATLGLARFEPEGQSALDKLSLGLAGGFRWPLTQHLGLRLDARAIATFFSVDSSFFCAGGCVARVDGDVWWQYQLSAGLALRF
ncbi:MAG: hypothetical protein HKO71_03700 [Pseudomonadales bacterium]|nr:hypothetical protein [Gammaproteobacteria bacterium]NNL56831.1 hypothetical protein [Pseudomonadales bacterium]